MDRHFIKPRLRKALALRFQKKVKEAQIEYKQVLELDKSCQEALLGLQGLST